ncbi:ABC transporter permease [Bartonella sp. HY406]|uniref:ABC transporter permease n=1 Tax=Bartonella sp. HY406 TaxID=2979331 RepID=UPI0021C92347|nr:ABC transporter permease [Bartonella sp. HY406]UXN03605.1 ABC transporter permease [Bartonella sp. HY406]
MIRYRIMSHLSWLIRYFWGGFAGLAGFFCFLAFWQLAHELYGSFVLPSPQETFLSLLALIKQDGFVDAAKLTAWRSLYGFLCAALIGTLGGLLCGYSFAAMRLMRPIITILLGVPPIGWIVLAIIWFEASGGSVIMIIAVASFPLIFMSSAQGIATRDRNLDAMARAFGIGWFKRLRTISLPQMVAHVMPAWSLSAGSAWKVAVMAELLSYSGGLGGILAQARTSFDVPKVTAVIMVVVIFALITEFGIIHPIRELLENWRHADEPWGVKKSENDTVAIKKD